jgi:NADPH:quinone reductase-like Zn-dependent oxidoreductase
MKTMQAIVLSDFGGAENLLLTEIPHPTIADDEVLVQVKALSLNPVDIKTRNGKALAGKLEKENPLILGWDIAGVVKEAGSKVENFKPGDEVFGMVNFPGHGQAYAEYVAAPASHLALKPANVDFAEAAAGTLAALTAWQAMVKHAKVKAGDRVLVHAAAGGVGHFAVQIAKQLGAYVIGTSSAKNREFVLSLGADEHVDYQAQPFEAAIDPVDFVLDTVGGDYIDRSLEVLKVDGTIVSIVSGKNEQVQDKAKAKGIKGLTMLVQSNGDDMKWLADWFEKGLMKAHVSQSYPLEKIADAHHQMETGHTVGKVVVTI